MVNYMFEYGNFCLSFDVQPNIVEKLRVIDKNEFHIRIQRLKFFRKAHETAVKFVLQCR